MQQFQQVFDHADQGQSSTQRLTQLHQGGSLVADYSITFCILTANSSWTEPALLALFRDGLNPEIQLELACRDEGLDLNECIALAIKLDQYLRGQGRRSMKGSQWR